MKKNKFLLLSSFLLALSVLTACSEQPKEKEKPAETVKAEDVSKKKEETKEEVSKVIPEGYKLGGDEKLGYILIPKDFADFIDVNVPVGSVTQYSNGIGTFIITMNETNTAQSFEENKNAIVQYLGDTAKVKETKVSGYDTYEIFNHYADEDYSLYVYLIDTPKGVKYMSIEFSGKDDGSREKILETYSIEPYEEKAQEEKADVKESKEPEAQKAAEAKPSETKTSEAKTSDTKSVDNKLNSISKGLEVKQVSKNTVELTVTGNFKEGREYVVSIYSDAQFDGLGTERIKASKVNGEIILKGQVKSKPDFSPATYNLVILDGENYDVISNNLEFVYK